MGKTFITTALCWHFRRIGLPVQAIKPVITGWECGAPEDSDTGKIIKSLGFEVNNEHMETVSPWRFKHPFSPHVAAEMEGKTIVYEEIVAFCNKNRNGVPDSLLLIEGAGGVMSPITNNKSCVDLIRDLDIDVILVVGSYLGAISHILTALEVLRGKQVHVILTVQREDDCYWEAIVEYVSRYSGQNIYVQEHIEKYTDYLWTATSPKIVDFVLRKTQ